MNRPTSIRAAVLGVVNLAVVAVLALPTSPAAADTTGSPDPVVSATVVGTAQTNLPPGSTLTGLGEGSAISITVTAGTPAPLGSNIFEIKTRVCRTGINISSTSAFSPTQGGNCIAAPFALGVDDDFVDTPTNSPFTSATYTFRTGTGGQRWHSSLNGDVTQFCDATHACTLWLDISVDSNTAASNNVWKHYTLNYVSRRVDNDVDGDLKSDVSIFRPDNQTWYTHPSLRVASTPDVQTTFGSPGDLAVPGDYDGDGKSDIAVFTPGATGLWSIRPSGGGSDVTLAYGQVGGDIPVAADYDGDGKTDIAVFRTFGGQQTWYIHPSGGTPDVAFAYGAAGDIPLPGDYDGDGKADLAIYRPSTGLWSLHKSSGGDTAATFGGIPGDIPLHGDFDGDAKADLAIFRPSGGWWYVHPSSGSADTGNRFGASGDIPVPVDYDSDGKADMAVLRASLGLWVTHPSTGAANTFLTFGVAGDVPVFVPPATRGL